jgi:hypothetical protein
MDGPHHDSAAAAGAAVCALWEDQLADYRAILRLAQEEGGAIAAERFDMLLPLQAQREHLTQRILARAQTIGAHGTRLQAPPQHVLAEITATIEAVLALDKSHTYRLEAEREAVAHLLQRLEQGRTVLRQYTPHRESLPEVLNRTV